MNAQRTAKTKKAARSRRGVVLTEEDFGRLQALSNYAGKPGSTEAWSRLEEKLESADVLEPADMPADVVTMNSRFRVTDLSSGQETEYMLTFPSGADPTQNRVSVLGRMGIAVLGRRVGESFECESPAGLKKLRIEEILYQPEAAGNYEGRL